ncbi:hypothetical protein GCM10010435_49160 [Winogradskya consettensis]|uniref:Uncharacterized protein n=1 Tax=Winogradskya consettensis TaxID=113560 RepID=A0A919SLM1_9ACTN|nr:hypothetical protein [Actinoplanes consettensis]GIM73193.1 hypothetical protein Aco04nite_34090 [Actinoplanes consettensis]
MDALTRDLLWLGWEDYTLLWQVVLNARHVNELSSLREAQDVAHGVLQTLLAGNLIELFRCPWAMDNDAYRLVAPAEHAAVLGDDRSWTIEGADGRDLVWFATTDAGLERYQQGTGWQ